MKRNKMQTDKEGSYDATSLSHMQHLHCIIGSSDVISVTFCLFLDQGRTQKLHSWTKIKLLVNLS